MSRKVVFSHGAVKRNLEASFHLDETRQFSVIRFSLQGKLLFAFLLGDFPNLLYFVFTEVLLAFTRKQLPGLATTK